jgi:hypothetical protein
VTTFEEENKLSTFDKRVPIRVVGTEVVKTTGDWRKLILE